MARAASGKWFVMMLSQNGDFVMPLMDDEEVALFDSEEEADACGSEHFFASEFGFKAFEVDF